MSDLEKMKFVVVPLRSEQYRKPTDVLIDYVYEFESLSDAEDFIKEDGSEKGYAILSLVRFVKVHKTTKLITIE